jgi:type I restriction enzyme M protein
MYRKSDLKPPRNLKQVFRRCHNAIYRRGLDSEDVAIDMVRIILAKYRDEQNPGDLCDFRCTPEEYETEDGRKRAADRVRALFRQVAADHPDTFGQAEEITIGDDGLAAVINELQPFRFLADDETEEVYDVIGTAFEVYVASHLKGSRGQFFTNRLVVNMMVELLDPNERDVILDPACGSGGFLIACLRYVRHKIVLSDRLPVAKLRELQRATEKLFGIDISPKLVRVAKTNMILNGDGHTGIAHGDSLHDLSELPESFRLRPGNANWQRPTVILTNPPFGASHELRVKEREVLERFKLGHLWVQSDDGWMRQRDAVNEGEGVPPEILFLERCVDWLAPGGKLAIVIARGVLDNRDALAARQFLLRNTRILGVINCHPNTFSPYNGTKASVILVEKKAAPGFQRDEDYPVFMAISQRIGQDSQGREIFRRDDNGNLVVANGQRVPDHDMHEIVASWRKFRAGRPIPYDAAWSVPLSRIVQSQDMRFNPTRYAPEAEQALAQVLEMADSMDWQVERLGDFASVFNGPRFKRPFAEEGVTSGEGIVRMFTPKALFEERGESAKYLSLSRATAAQRRAIEVLTLKRDWIMIVDSGTA